METIKHVARRKVVAEAAVIVAAARQQADPEASQIQNMPSAAPSQERIINGSKGRG